MKNAYKYLAALLALVLAAPVFTGCTDDDKYTLSSTSAKPSDKFNATIQFVSRLNDGALITSDADYTALNNYMVNTLKSREEAWLTLFDRSDNANLSKVMEISLNTYRWTAFAFNGLANRTTYKGSTLFFNQPTRLVRATASGKGCYVTGFSPLMEGTRTDKDEAGTVTGTVEIAYNINFRTARFETNDQIAAFGGEEGVMNKLKRENMNMLMIGTVKNDLYGSLESAVKGADGSFDIYNIATGSAYTIFMLAQERFWGFTSVSSTSVGNGIEAYAINVMW